MENLSRTIITTCIIALVLIIGGLIYASRTPMGPSKYDGFAQCLKDKGALFYGAFWCSHCQNQKALFGSAKQYLPYIECSTADGRGLKEICRANQIQSYPTWVFPDFSTTTGEISLAVLAEKTGCELPQ